MWDISYGTVQSPKLKRDHPATNISWDDAVAYCQWLTEVTDKHYRLPTEAEWEKAVRGTDGRLYPWGNEWDAERCNYLRLDIVGGRRGDTTPVEAYPDGASPYGVLDMAGNVREWCATKWQKPYPYDVEEDEWSPDYLKDYLKDSRFRVLRGGSGSDSARSAQRFREPSYYGGGIFGFRVVVSPI